MNPTFIRAINVQGGSMSIDPTKRNYKCELCDKEFKHGESGRYCQSCQSKINRNVRNRDKIQHKFGGCLPEYINMYFAQRLEILTKWIIGLTVVLGLLAAIQIVLVFR